MLPTHSPFAHLEGEAYGWQIGAAALVAANSHPTGCFDVEQEGRYSSVLSIFPFRSFAPIVNRL